MKLKYCLKKISVSQKKPNVKYYENSQVEYVIEKVGEFPISGVGIDKYLPLLPPKKLSVSLGEGNTPLRRLYGLGKKYNLSDLWVKQEEHNPTGCFKDRESAVIVSLAVEKKIKKVNIASSGNAALSTSAYARKAGIQCNCFIPMKTSTAKKKLISLFGGKITEINGIYEDVYRFLVDKRPAGWNVTTGQCPERTEGDKTIAFEVFEQIGVPDVVVVPCGNGGCLAGIFKGFYELTILGKTKKLPKIVGVQVKSAAPLAQAIKTGNPYVGLDGTIPDSIAEGIVAKESYSAPVALEALLATGGYIVEVTEWEINNALKLLINEEAIVAEPTSAAAFAALRKLKCDKTAKIVVINTGSGMKNLNELIQITGSS